ALRHGRGRAGPLRGLRLREAIRWLETNPDDVILAERAFIAGSRRRHRWFTIAWRSAVAVIVVLMMASTTFAVLLQHRQAQILDQLHHSAADTLAHESVRRRGTDLSSAVLATLGAYPTSPTPAARGRPLETSLRLQEIR